VNLAQQLLQHLPLFSRSSRYSMARTTTIVLAFWRGECVSPPRKGNGIVGRSTTPLMCEMAD
jgi:hypothetical protein